MATLGDKLWEPDAAYRERARVTVYQRWLARERGLTFADYHALWRWSVADLETFWRSVWDYFDVGAVGRGAARQGRVDPGPILTERTMPGARWFPEANLNYTRHMLAPGADEDVALHHFSETRSAGVVTRGELRQRVANVARGLLEAGVQPGERVAAYLPNTPEAVVAMLATAAVGGVWSSCSPDFGANSVLDRFRQIRPKVLFAVDGYRYGGKAFDRRAEVKRLVAALPSVETVVHVPYLFAESDAMPPGARPWAELAASPSGAADDPIIDTLPFDHPLWIVYSSGTTGLPKGMVHGHGSIVIEHLKLQSMHLGLGPGSCLFFYTTTGWIMFNLLVGALIVGASAVLYDGNPGYPDEGTLFSIAERTGATNFGTSPTFVSMLAQRGARPGQRYDLSRLDGVVCTGSPLTPESFAWIYDHVKADLWVSSISGGTDVATGFVGGVQTLPVHGGELQGPCLGVDVQAFDAEGRAVIGTEGEMVITQPMPSMPLYFWDDPSGARYRESYFERFPGVWCHGDLLKVTERGSYVIAGRSDSTLNRHGVRIGTSEIYRTLETMDAVQDAIVVHLDGGDGHDKLVLFVVLADGYALDAALGDEIRAELRGQRSPRHVPEQILAVPAVPYTLTGKKMEVPLKRILMGADPSAVANRDAMSNPEALDAFVAMLEQVG